MQICVRFPDCFEFFEPKKNNIEKKKSKMIYRKLTDSWKMFVLQKSIKNIKNGHSTLLLSEKLL